MEVQDTERYTGLREDIECLLQRFLQTQNVRFQMFAGEWRKLNFSFIHYGIDKGHEKKEAMQEAFRISTDYFLPPYDLQHRVGALYMLYALYITQPHVPKFKIRISVDQWQSVTMLIETLESQGHLDAIYVFYKLMMSKAFMFTAKPKKMIFHSSYVEGKSDQNPTERWLDRHRHSLMTECFDDNTLEVHHDLHEQYQKMKVNLGLHDNTSLMVVRESITEYIVKRFEKLEADFETSQELNQATDTSEPDIEDQGSKISQIKAHSYSTMAKPSRSRRHLQQPAEPPSSQNRSAARSKVAKGKSCGGRKDQQRVTTHSSITETSGPSEDSDETWTPHSIKNRKKQHRKKSATKGPSELFNRITGQQVEHIQAKKSNKTNPTGVSDEDTSDSNLEAETASDVSGTSAMNRVMMPSPKTQMPHNTANSVDDNSDASPVSQTLSDTEATASSLFDRMQKVTVMVTDMKMTRKQTRAGADEPSTQPSLASTAPKKATDSKVPPEVTAKKAEHSKTHRKTHTEQLEDIQSAGSTVTAGKRGRSNIDSSNTSPEVTPKRKFRGSVKEETSSKDELSKADDEPHSSRTPRRRTTRYKTKTSPATPLKKTNCPAVEEVSAETKSERTAHPEGNNESTSGEKETRNHRDTSTQKGGVKNVGAGSRNSAGYNISSSLRGRGSSEVVAEQSSIASPRELRSASVRGRGSISPRDAGTVGQRTSPRGQEELSAGDQRSTFTKEDLTPRRNTSLKIRGGGIGARTRGARRNVSK